MIYYFIVLDYREDYRPNVEVIWYGETSDCWDLRYDTKYDKLESNTYVINNYAL